MCTVVYRVSEGNKLMFYALSLLVIIAIYIVLEIIARVFKSSDAIELEQRHRYIMAKKALKAEQDAAKRIIDRITLSESESALLSSLDFDPDLILKLKKLTKSEAKPLLQIHHEDITYESPDAPCEGIFFPIPDAYFQTSHNYGSVIRDYGDLMDECESEGYLLFMNDSHTYGKGMAVIKGSEIWDAIRYRKTRADNFGLCTEDIIERLKTWDVCSVIGVSFDWVLIKFANYSSDPNRLAQEIYTFCPDTVMQGCGTIEHLEDYLDVSDEILLWWD